MAIHAHSTTAPARPLLPLDRRAIGRDGWARAREIAAQLGGEIRDHVAEGMRQAWDAARRLLPATAPNSGDTPDAVRADLDALVATCAHMCTGLVPANDTPSLPLPAPLPPLAVALSRRRAIFGAVAVDEPDTAAEARALHARRELHGALDWGFAFLDAFDLGPLALDVIDGAIARMDDRDAADEDREPYLAGWYNGALDPTGEAEGVNEDGTDLDAGEDDGLILGEGDGADDEPHLGSAAGDGDQRHWNQGDHRDVEAVNEGGGGQHDPNWTERQPRGVYAMYDDMRALRRRAQAMKRRGAPPPPEAVRIWTPAGVCNVMNVDGTPVVWAVEPMVAHG